MTMDEVIALEGAAGKKDTEHTHGPVTFEELEYGKTVGKRLKGKKN